MQSENQISHSLLSLSSVDGRHYPDSKPLQTCLSEFAYHKYRAKSFVEYLKFICQKPEISFAQKLSPQQIQNLDNIVTNFSTQDAIQINNIDRYGFNGNQPIHHDLKAVEYFVKQNISDLDILELVHIGLTSEDINNLAQSYMFLDFNNSHLIPATKQFAIQLSNLIDETKSIPMLSKTHGQPATPTTFGKEFANYLDRISNQLAKLTSFQFQVKFSGAVGSHNAMHFAFPSVDWMHVSHSFIESQGFEFTYFATQINLHDNLTEYLNIVAQLNNILCSLCQNTWSYISNHYFTQENRAGEVGSSTMPHKINPWRLEVTEGLTRKSTYQIQGFTQALSHSRFQRDLSDHEVLRAIPIALADTYVALKHINQEFSRLRPNPEQIQSELDRYPVVMLEAYQTYLRVQGYSKPYELFKDFSRGQNPDINQIHTFLQTLDIRDSDREYLLSLTPQTYIGYAQRLATQSITEFNQLS